MKSVEARRDLSESRFCGQARVAVSRGRGGRRWGKGGTHLEQAVHLLGRLGLRLEQLALALLVAAQPLEHLLELGLPPPRLVELPAEALALLGRLLGLGLEHPELLLFVLDPELGLLALGRSARQRRPGSRDLAHVPARRIVVGVGRRRQASQERLEELVVG